ncbi:MAG: SDR family oxidoreductase [Actinobacteria bacterium]|nr:SDR family oxidoreductase [Actinomycetota bacterium]
MDLGIKGRVAIVTACSRGLGKAAALALADEGVNLVVNARSRELLEGICDSVKTQVAVVDGDLADRELPQRLVDTAVERFGRLDILVANNGGPPTGGAFEVSEQQMEEAIDSGVMVIARLVRAAAPVMTQGGWGRVCIIASGSVKQPMDDLVLSNMARPGMWGWAKTAATELAGRGVTLNVICPGLHDTNRAVELGRQGRPYIGDPEAFGRIVAFSCSAHTDFMTATTLVVDGGRVRGL